MATGAVGAVVGDGAVLAGAGLASLLVGVGLLYSRYRALARWWRRRGTTDPVPPPDVSDRGYTAVRGTAAVASGRPLTAPFSGTEAIAYAYRIEQHTADVGWWTVADGGDSVRFRVEGDGGSVLVDPRGRVPDTEMASSDVDVGETVPEAVRDRMRESETFDLDERPEYLMGSPGDRRRFGEGALPAGADVAVYGAARTDDTGSRQIVDAGRSAQFWFGTGSPPGSLEPAAPRLLVSLVATALGLAAAAAGALLLGEAAGPAFDAVRSLA